MYINVPARTCPNCGHCPACGRSYPYPAYVPYVPNWPYYQPGYGWGVTPGNAVGQAGQNQ